MSAPLSSERLAHELGASDIFVFRRVTSSRFIHVGGAGRGKSWTGRCKWTWTLSHLAPSCGSGSRCRYAIGNPAAYSGHYHAAAAVTVRLNQDVLVVFRANAAETPGFEPSTAIVVAAAERAVEWCESVTRATHLANKLKIVHARKALADRRGADGTVSDALGDVAEVAATALSCEVAVTWLPDGRSHIYESGWAVPDRGAAVRTVMHGLWDGRADLPRSVQDATQLPLAFPFDHASGVRSYYVLPIGAPTAALLLLAHTEVEPRGFTQLCQALGKELMLTADTVLARALLRERLLHAVAEESDARQELARANAELAKVALHDPLTGLPNRVLLGRPADGLG